MTARINEERAIYRGWGWGWERGRLEEDKSLWGHHRLNPNEWRKENMRVADELRQENKEETLNYWIFVGDWSQIYLFWWLCSLKNSYWWLWTVWVPFDFLGFGFGLNIHLCYLERIRSHIILTQIRVMMYECQIHSWAVWLGVKLRK